MSTSSPAIQTIEYDKVGELGGFWLRATELKVLSDDEGALNLPIRPDTVRDKWLASDRDATTLKPHERAARSIFTTLSNSIVFKHIFIDRLAATLARFDENKLAALFGPLSPIVKLVNIPVDVYREAATGAQNFISCLPNKQQYLQDEFYDVSERNMIKAADLKDIYDSIFVEILDKPSSVNWSRFVNTGGDVERLFVYFELQRLSGAPVQLSHTTERWLKIFAERMLPTLKSALRFSPQSEIERSVFDQVQRTAEAQVEGGSIWKEDAVAPPIVELILQEMAESQEKIGPAEASMRVRNTDFAARYRDWLWEYVVARQSRDIFKMQRMLRDMARHVDGMNMAGRGDTYWTSVLRFNVSASIKGLGLGIPLAVRLPRFIDSDYVGFIGEWFTPRQIS